MPKQLELAPEPTSAREARLFVAQWVRSWGYPRIINAATLLTSELATNAVIHGGGHRFTVLVSNTGHGVRVDVRDGGTGEPRLRPLQEIDRVDGPPGGRGLHVVEGLASRWGYELDEEAETKRVWFELDAASSAAFGWAVGG